MRRFVSAIRLPAIAFAVLLIPFSIYFIHVRSQKEYLQSRNFRLLATMSDQVRAKVNGFESMIGNAVNSQRFEYKAYLKDQQLKCLPQGCEETPIGPGALASTLNISVEREGQAPWLHLFYKQDSIRIVRRIDLEKQIIQPFVPADISEVFDDLIIADQRDQSVIFQQSHSGLRFTEIGAFLPKEKFDQARSGNPRSDGTRAQEALSSIRFTTSLIETKISGSDYKVFLQPIPLSVHRLDDPDGRLAEWVLCGLVRSDRFLSESLMVSYSIIMLFAFLLLVAFVSWPLLKMHCLGRRERFGMSDGILVGFSIIAASGVLTVFLLATYDSYGLERESDEQLVTVAERLKSDLAEELEHMTRQLVAFGSQARSSPAGSTREKILEDNSPYWKEPIYPYFDLAVWVNAEGEEKIKWTSEKRITPFINVSDRSVYTAFHVDQERWFLRDPTAPFILHAENSPNTGQNLAVMAMEDRGRVNGVRYNFLANRPLSLFQAVLPAGFGFCLISKQGQVWFHSRQERNLHENFFEECENNRALRSAVFGGAGMFANAHYLGREHSLYISPVNQIQKNPWSLVTFRDRVITRTVSLEVMTLSLVLLGTFMALLVIFSGLTYAFIRPIYPARWLWPSSDRGTEYRRLGLAFAAVIGAFLLWLFHADPMELILGATLLPCIAIAASAIVLHYGERIVHAGRRLVFSTMILVPCAFFVPVWFVKKDAWIDAVVLSACWIVVGLTVSTEKVNRALVEVMPWRKRVPEWRTFYALSVFGLVILIGVLPAIAFWKAARQFETSLYVMWGQRKLASEFQERANAGRMRMRDLGIDKVHSAEFLESGWSLPENRMSGAYHNAFYGTHASASPSRSLPVHPLSHWKWLLSKMTMPYNQTALEMRGLAPARLADNTVDPTWRWEDWKDQSRLLTSGYGGAGADRTELELISSVPGFWRLPVDGFGWLVLVFLLGGGALLITCLYLYIRKFVNRGYLLNLREENCADSFPEGSLDHNMLVLGTVRSRKSAWLHEHGHFQSIDVVKIANSDLRPDNLNLAPAETPIAIDHFEYNIDDPKSAEQKLRLLEELIYTRRRNNVVILSSVDPVFHLWSSNTPSGDANLDRWAGVLNHFRRFVYKEPKDSTFATEIPGKLALLYGECRWTSALRGIGRRICDRLCPQAEFTDEQILSEVLFEADTYYRSIWAACSRDEKIVLVHLAQSGMVNPKNDSAIQQLLRKGLLVRDPVCRIMNESFRRFVWRAHNPDELRAWVREAEGWRSIRTGIATVLIGLALLFFIAQRGVLESWIPYVTGIAGVLGAVGRALNAMRSSRTPVADGG